MYGFPTTAPNQNTPRPGGMIQKPNWRPPPYNGPPTYDTMAPPPNPWRQAGENPYKQYMVPGIGNPTGGSFGANRQATNPFLDNQGNPVIADFNDLAGYRQWKQATLAKPEEPYGFAPGHQGKWRGNQLGLSHLYDGKLDEGSYNQWVQRMQQAHLASLNGQAPDPFKDYSAWAQWDKEQQKRASQPQPFTPQQQGSQMTRQAPMASSGTTQTPWSVQPTPEIPTQPAAQPQAAPQTATPQGQASPPAGQMIYTGIQSTPVPQQDIQAGVNQLSNPPAYGFGPQFGAASGPLSEMLSNMMSAAGLEQANAFARNATQQNQAYQLAAERARANAGLGWGNLGNQQLASSLQNQQSLINPLMQLLGYFL